MENRREKDQKMLKKSAFERIVLRKNKDMSKDDQKRRTNRFLIIINILGSTGPIRFVVNEKDLVSEVIETALKSYAREERLPVLGSDSNNFLLYSAHAGFEALSPLKCIGYGGRNFVLCKKQACPPKTEAQSKMITQKGSGGWKAWLHKSFSFKISSH